MKSCVGRQLKPSVSLCEKLKQSMDQCYLNLQMRKKNIIHLSAKNHKACVSIMCLINIFIRDYEHFWLKFTVKKFKTLSTSY